MERIVVSICGPSGAGKSQLAKAVVARLGEDRCGRIPGDNYLNTADEPLAAYLARPLQYDWQLLQQAASAPIGSVSSTPDFDFDTMTRRRDSGGTPFTIRPIMVIDAMYPFPLAYVTILLAAPADVRRTRIVERDRRWESRVIDRWDILETSRRRLESLGHTYDLVLDGTRPLTANAELIVGYFTRT